MSRVMEIDEVVKDIIAGVELLDTGLTKDNNDKYSKFLNREGILSEVHIFFRTLKTLNRELALDDVRAEYHQRICSRLFDSCSLTMLKQLINLFYKSDKIDLDNREDYNALVTLYNLIHISKVIELSSGSDKDVDLSQEEKYFQELMTSLKDNVPASAWAIDKLYSHIPTSMQDVDKLKSVIEYLKVAF